MDEITRVPERTASSGGALGCDITTAVGAVSLLLQPEPARELPDVSPGASDRVTEGLPWAQQSRQT